MALTLFFDGQCPLCEKEISHLKKRNYNDVIAFVDINAAEFSQTYPDMDWDALNERIHAIDESGEVYIGLDATHKAWSLVGFPWLYASLRWPIIRFFADKAYLLFARNRYKISYWLTGKERCDKNCGVKNYD